MIILEQFEGTYRTYQYQQTWSSWPWKKLMILLRMICWLQSADNIDIQKNMKLKVFLWLDLDPGSFTFCICADNICHISFSNSCKNKDIFFFKQNSFPYLAFRRKITNNIFFGCNLPISKNRIYYIFWINIINWRRKFCIIVFIFLK